MQEVAAQTQYIENHIGDLPEAYDEQVPSTSVQYTEEVTNVPVDYVEEIAAPMPVYEEEVAATTPIMHHMAIYNGNNDASKPKKSLREILGMTDPRQNSNTNEAALGNSSIQNQQPQSIISDTSHQNIWTGDNSQVYTNLQPVPYSIPNQGNGNNQIVASPGALSDDSGVYLLSPNNLPACSQSTNSIPPVSPYKTVTISEPQTQAKIVEIVPGKVRSINMHKEMVIDGKPVSYLLEGVLVAPSPVSDTDETSEVRTTDSSSDSSPDAYEAKSIADEMSIDGKPIALLLQNILDDINEEETSKETSNVTNTSMPFPGIHQDCAVNQVMIDGKPIYQMFEMFSQTNQATRNETVSLPSISTLTQKQQQAASYVESNTVPLAVQLISTTSTSSYSTTSTQASTSYALPTGEGGSPTLTDIQETAQTLINMASMPMDTAITSTVSTDDLQSTIIPDSTTLVDPDEANDASAAKLTYYKPSTDSRAFINALISDSDSNSGGEFEKLLQDGIAPSSMEDIKNLDRLIDKIFANVERNKSITKDFIASLPDLEKKFLVSMSYG